MSELKEYHSSFTGPEIDFYLTKVKDGSLTADIEKELAEKADVNGRYPEMSVGFADDLVGRGESVPAEYSFRASGGKSIKDGAARIKRLKGNSVVWNQGIEGLNLKDGARIIKGHKYLMGADFGNAPDSSSVSLYYKNDGANVIAFSIFKNTPYIIATSPYGGTAPSDAWIYAYVEGEASITNLHLIDLTKMFGAGNEPTTIEEYYARKPIVADEYAYNEGEVIHMTAEGIKSVGDNAWDEEWEVGAIENSGTISPSDSHIRSKNYIKVISGETYYMLGNFTVIYYDENYNQVDWWSIGGSRELTIPSNVQYIKISAKGNTYNHDILISLYHSGWKQDTDAGYQPYWEDRLMFDKRIKDEFPDGMSRWDMVYNKNGKGYIVHRLGVEDMGDMNWGYFNGAFYASVLDKAVGRYDVVDIISARYSAVSGGGSEAGKDGEIWSEFTTTNVYVKDSAYSDIASFKSAMAGVPLYYQLAEPTIIEYDEPFNLDYRVADFGTEEIIAPQPSAPISADIIYQFNAVDMIREHELEITELQRIIATMQAQLTSLTSNNGGQ